MLFEPVSKARLAALCRRFPSMPQAASEALHRARLDGDGAAVFADCLSLRFEEEGLYAFTYPIPLSVRGEEERMLCRLEDYAMDEELPLVLTDIPREKMHSLRLRYPRAEAFPLGESEDWWLLRALTEAEILEDMPTWAGERVTLTAFTEADTALYAALCRDDEGMRYYGYDMRTELSSDDDVAFLKETLAEWERRRTLPFAVRAEGRTVGELVLYRFDARGGASLAVRLLLSERGKGYASDAVVTLLHHAFSELSLRTLHAAVREENLPSLRLFDPLMERTGTKDHVVYYKKTADAV